MFYPSHHEVKLEVALTRALTALDDHPVDSKEYDQILDQLAKLHQLKLDSNPKPKPVSLDTLAMILANLLGIALIIKHEEFNVITTKSLGFVAKPR